VFTIQLALHPRRTHNLCTQIASPTREAELDQHKEHAGAIMTSPLSTAMSPLPSPGALNLISDPSESNRVLHSGVGAERDMAPGMRRAQTDVLSDADYRHMMRLHQDLDVAAAVIPAATVASHGSSSTASANVAQSTQGASGTSVMESSLVQQSLGSVSHTLPDGTGGRDEAVPSQIPSASLQAQDTQLNVAPVPSR